MRTVFSNPLLRLEYLRRFRTPGAAWTIALLAVLPILGVSMIYSSTTTETNVQMWDQMGNPIDLSSTGFPDNLQSIDQIDLGGGSLLIGTASLLLVVLTLLVPAIVGSSIAGERASDTLQPLQLTRMRPFDIVAGKLIASLGYIVLLLVCLAPVLIVPSLAGGLELDTIVKTYLIVLAVTLELGAVALFVSSRAKRPLTAVIGSLIITLALIAGPWIIAGIIAITNQNTDVDEISRIIVLSPITLFAALRDVGDTEIPVWWKRGDTMMAVVSWAVIVLGCIAASARGVRAPVERDR